MNRKLAGGLLALLLLATAAPVFATEAGFGGIGIRGGTLFFTQDEDLKELGMPRISGDLVLSYSWTDKITADVTIGWGWNRLDTGNDSFYIVQVAFKAWPSKEQITQWMRYLKDATVCDTRLPDRACVAPGAGGPR